MGDSSFAPLPPSQHPSPNFFPKAKSDKETNSNLSQRKGRIRDAELDCTGDVDEALR